MNFQRNLFIFVLFLWPEFNITKLECKPIQSGNQTSSNQGQFKRTLGQASQMIPDFPLGISEVFDNASGVFAQFLNKILAKKKFLGIESFLYE